MPAPVMLMAGEVSTTNTSINGMVLDSSTGKAVNGQVLVALEQKDSAGVDRVVMSTMANADGSFVFCPIPAGTYDVVIVGVSTSGTAYAPNVAVWAASYLVGPGFALGAGTVVSAGVKNSACGSRLPSSSPTSFSFFAAR